MKSVVNDIRSLLEGLPRSSGTGSSGTDGVDYEEPEPDGEYETGDKKDAKAVKKQVKDRKDMGTEDDPNLRAEGPKKGKSKDGKKKPASDEAPEGDEEDEDETDEKEESIMRTANLTERVRSMIESRKLNGKRGIKESLDRIVDSIDVLVEMHVAVAMDQTPPLDTSLYPVRPGLMGPYHFKNKKVLYYDPGKGQYYDTDQDRHLTPYEVSVVIS